LTEVTELPFSDDPGLVPTVHHTLTTAAEAVQEPETAIETRKAHDEKRRASRRPASPVEGVRPRIPGGGTVPAVYAPKPPADPDAGLHKSPAPDARGRRSSASKLTPPGSAQDKPGAGWQAAPAPSTGRTGAERGLPRPAPSTATGGGTA